LGVTVDASGNIYIAGIQHVRKITADGVINTLTGFAYGFDGDGGPAQSAHIGSPFGIAADTAGNLYIADYGNCRIRKVTPGGVISTVAGNGSTGSGGDGGPALSAQLNFPQAVAVDAAGDLYIADTGNHRIRKVTSAGVINTVVGTGTRGFAGDNGPAVSAQLAVPYDVAVDAAGNLFIADTGNSRVRRVTPDGTIRTVAGRGSSGFSGDGQTATSAGVNPVGIAVDSAGNIRG
jgi:sugar lactone lactonase YvrE